MPWGASFPKPAIGFLDLAGEIRNQIYKYILVDKERRGSRKSHKKLQAQILRTNRQVYGEASSILYGDNTYHIDVQPDMVLASRCPRLSRDPKLALAKDWSINISLLDPGKHEEEYAAEIPLNIPKVKRHLRAICMALAHVGPQQSITITVEQNMSLCPALYSNHEGLLEAFRDVRAVHAEMRYAVMLGSEEREAATFWVDHYMVSVQATLHGFQDFNLAAQLYREAQTYARIFFSTRTEWVKSIRWGNDGLDDLPQVLDLDELLLQRAPSAAPHDEWLWEEVMRTDYMPEFAARLCIALNVLENRFALIEEQRKTVTSTYDGNLASLQYRVDWINVHSADLGSFVARTDVLDGAFGLIPYIESFMEPLENQSPMGQEHYYSEWEKRRHMSFEDRAEDFLPALLVDQLRTSYNDVLEGELTLEELLEALVEVREWCETQYWEMTRSREYFYMRPLFRQWMAHHLPNTDWKEGEY